MLVVVKLLFKSEKSVVVVKEKRALFYSWGLSGYMGTAFTACQGKFEGGASESQNDSKTDGQSEKMFIPKHVNYRHFDAVVADAKSQCERQAPSKNLHDLTTMDIVLKVVEQQTETGNRSGRLNDEMQKYVLSLNVGSKRFLEQMTAEQRAETELKKDIFLATMQRYALDDDERTSYLTKNVSPQLWRPYVPEIDEGKSSFVLPIMFKHLNRHEQRNILNNLRVIRVGNFGEHGVPNKEVIKVEHHADNETEIYKVPRRSSYVQSVQHVKVMDELINESKQNQTNFDEVKLAIDHHMNALKVAKTHAAHHANMIKNAVEVKKEVNSFDFEEISTNKNV